MAQDGLDTNDVWRQVPPEEKLALMAQVQGKSVVSVVATILIGSTLSMSLKAPWLLWTSLIFSPLVFHAVSTKAWKGLKPKLLLEYLAARSAARRYAFSYRSKELTLKLLMRGVAVELATAETQEEESQAAIETSLHKPFDVWMALFGDCVVIMREQRGGAELTFAHLLNLKLDCKVQSPSGKEYSSDCEVILGGFDVTGRKRMVKLTSPYPAALIVFGKKIQTGIAQSPAAALAKVIPQLIEPASDPGDDFLFNNQ